MTTLPTNSSEDPSNGDPSSGPRWRRRAGRAISAAGATLVVLALAFTLILCGAALFQDGPVAFVFVLIFGSVPIALGVGMAHLGTRGYWSRSIDVRGLWRMPGAAGIAIALVSLPLIFLLPDMSILIAFVALCLYPILDVPRILARPSWWRGAIVSALVWLAVFAGLGGAVEGVRHPGEDSMIFLVPFMMYPLVLGISGVVRLGVRGRPSASSVRMAAILGVAACALLVGVPITMSIIPVVLEKVTGYSPPNTVYSENGDVVTAAPGQLSVRLTGGDTKSFRLGPETKFDFRGPGSPQVKGPAAGPAWLTAGQRVGLEYVIRHREAQAQYVTIWIERKGCKDDAKWTAAVSRTGPAPPPGTPGLAGTTWDSELGSPDAPGGPQRTTLEFLAGNGLAWQNRGSTRYTDGGWRQDGALVIVEVNDCYAVYEGREEGDEIKGEFSNIVGARDIWTAHRNQDSVSVTPR